MANMEEVMSVSTPAMTANASLHDKLSAEMRSKQVFDQAQGYAYQYMATSSDSRVVPSPEALAALTQFNEPLPDVSTEVKCK
jgi:hypothetical protein